MKDLKQTTTKKKIWSTPSVQAIELNTAKHGNTGSSDGVPQGRS